MPILPCLVCGKIFESKSNLRQHAQTHLPKAPEIKEYPCDLCDKIYERKQYLNHHIKSSHGQKKVKSPVGYCVFQKG